MNYNYLKKLEFEKILTKLSFYCHTYLGKEKALNLKPSNKKEAVEILLNETNEAISLIERKSMPPISEIQNIEPYIKLLSSSSPISIPALLSIASILEMAEHLNTYFADKNIENQCENLNMYFSSLYTNKTILEKIKKNILDENTIADNASSTLFKIRKRKQQITQNIKSTLNNILHSSSFSKYIQESVVTIRNNRYVIPVKQEYKSLVKGFIHDISSTGLTVFIEPISIFELNNELNNLNAEELIEIEKILFSLSSMLFPIVNEIDTNFKLIADIDLIFAKAHYSMELNAVKPILNDKKELNLINARHPLIDKKNVVPININIGNTFSLLIITGPNTGGKTVTLKTVRYFRINGLLWFKYTCIFRIFYLCI